jgi:hypothetical protein
MKSLFRWPPDWELLIHSRWILSSSPGLLFRCINRPIRLGEGDALSDTTTCVSVDMGHWRTCSLEAVLETESPVSRCVGWSRVELQRLFVMALTWRRPSIVALIGRHQAMPNFFEPPAFLARAT